MAYPRARRRAQVIWLTIAGLALGLSFLLGGCASLNLDMVPLYRGGPSKPSPVYLGDCYTLAEDGKWYRCVRV